MKNKDGEELKSKFAGKVRIGDKEVSFEGLAMLLETMNPRETGLYFFRRGRLIIGNNGREKPWIIFGDGSSPFSKRCRIVVRVDQIPVSFNKSSFDISEEDKRSFEGLLDDIVKGKNDARLNLKSIANKHRKEKKVESEKVRGSKESEVKKEEELSFIGSGKKSEQVQPKQEQIKNTKKLDGPVENFNSLHVDSVINDNLENYLDLYKVAENRMSIQVNKRKFLENYTFLKEEEKWNFFEKTLTNIMISFLFLRSGSNYLWKDSDITSEFLESINKFFRNSNKKEEK